MKSSSRRSARRELALLSGMCALAMLPLYFLVRSRPTPPAPPPMRAPRGNPNSPWRSESRFDPARIALSPTGRFLAGICPPRPPKNATPTPTAVGFLPSPNRELVIWDVATGGQLARTSLDNIDDNHTLGWSLDEKYIGLEGNSAQLWEWPKRVLAPVPLPMPDGFIRWSRFDWKRQNLVFWLDDQSLTFQPLPGATALPGSGWQWPRLRDFSGPSLAPQPGATLRVAEVSQAPIPTSTPLPVPTPLPTPTPVPAEAARLKKFDALCEELAVIVEKMDATESEVAAKRWEAQGNKILTQIHAVETPLAPRPTPAPHPVPPPRKWMDVALRARDGHRALWQRRLPGEPSLPEPIWSPDGQILVLSKSPWPNRKSGAWDRSGLLFSRWCHGPHPGPKQHWQSHPPRNPPVLDRRPTLGNVRQRRPKRGRRWPFRPPKRAAKSPSGRCADSPAPPETFSADASGKTWVFASGETGWVAFSRAEIEAAVGRAARK